MNPIGFNFAPLNYRIAVTPQTSPRPAREIWSFADWEENMRTEYTDSLIPEHITEGAD